jgi:hypothetical protein
MSCEVEIHLGSAEGVLAVPNAALRTDGDVASAAQVLGLDMTGVREQLAAGPGSRPASAPSGRSSAAAGGETITFRDREITLPEGLTAAEVQPVLDKIQSGGFQSMTEEDRAIMARVRAAGGMGGQRAGGQRPGGAPGQPEGAGVPDAAASPGEAGADDVDVPVGRTTITELAGRYVVFVMRGGVPTAVRIRTGLTDMDYSEVLSGLTVSDSVLVLPSAALVQSQQELQERIEQRTGGAMPGMTGGSGRPPGR